MGCQESNGSLENKIPQKHLLEDTFQTILSRIGKFIFPLLTQNTTTFFEEKKSSIQVFLGQKGRKYFFILLKIVWKKILFGEFYLKNYKFLMKSPKFRKFHFKVGQTDVKFDRN